MQFKAMTEVALKEKPITGQYTKSRTKNASGSIIEEMATMNGYTPRARPKLSALSNYTNPAMSLESMNPGHEQSNSMYSVASLGNNTFPSNRRSSRVTSIAGSIMPTPKVDWKLGVDTSDQKDIFFILYFFILTSTGTTFAIASTINTNMRPATTLYSKILLSYTILVSIVCMVILHVIVTRFRQNIVFTPRRLSFYMRMGLVGLTFIGGIYHFIMAIEPVEAQIKGLNYHFMPLEYIKVFCVVLISFMQTYFIFKYHQVAITVHTSLAKFCLIHLAASNIFHTAYTFVDEVLHRNLRSPQNEKSLSLGYYHVIQIIKNESDSRPIGKTISFSSRNYIIYFLSEYTMLMACLFIQLYMRCTLYMSPSRIEQSDSHEGTLDNFQSYPDLAASEGDILNATQPQQSKKFAKCHKSHSGLIVAIILTAIVLVLLIFTSLNPDDDEHKELYIVIDCISSLVYIFGIILVVGVAIRLPRGRMLVKRHHFHPDSDTFLLRLLVLITNACSILYSLFSVLAMIDGIDRYPSLALGVLEIIDELLSLIQTIVQTGLIEEGLRRRITRSTSLVESSNSSNEHNNAGKPGRIFLTILIFFNMIIWVEEHMSNELNTMHPRHTEFFGFLTWGLISGLLVPFYLLYRFLSCISLAVIWNRAYK